MMSISEDPTLYDTWRPSSATAGQDLVVLMERSDQVIAFKTTLLKLIRENDYQSVEALFDTQPVYILKLSVTSLAFNMLLEALVEQGDNAASYKQAGIFCSLLKTLGFDNEFSRIFYLACLLKSGNLREASAEITTYGYRWEYVDSLLQSYQEFPEKQPLTDLFSLLKRYQTQLQLEEQGQKLGIRV